MSIEGYGPQPAGSRPSVRFPLAIGTHADLVDWWTIKPDFVTLNPTASDIDAVQSRKLLDVTRFGGGHSLVKGASAPAFALNQIGGRPGAVFTSANVDQLAVDAVLPAGSFTVTMVFDAPASVTNKMLVGSQNSGGRFAAYVRENSGTQYLIVEAGPAGSSAQVVLPRLLTGTAAIFSWDEAAGELGVAMNGGSFTTVTQVGAVVDQTSLGIGSYRGSGANSLDGVIADVQVWRVAVHKSENAEQLSLIRRYARAAYGIG